MKKEAIGKLFNDSKTNVRIVRNGGLVTMYYRNVKLGNKTEQPKVTFGVFGGVSNA